MLGLKLQRLAPRLALSERLVEAIQLPAAAREVDLLQLVLLLVHILQVAGLHLGNILVAALHANGGELGQGGTCFVHSLGHFGHAAAAVFDQRLEVLQNRV